MSSSAVERLVSGTLRNAPLPPECSAISRLSGQPFAIIAWPVNLDGVQLLLDSTGIVDANGQLCAFQPFLFERASVSRSGNDFIDRMPYYRRVACLEPQAVSMWCLRRWAYSLHALGGSITVWSVTEDYTLSIDLDDEYGRLKTGRTLCVRSDRRIAMLNTAHESTNSCIHEIVGLAPAGSLTQSLG